MFIRPLTRWTLCALTALLLITGCTIIFEEDGRTQVTPGAPTPTVIAATPTATMPAAGTATRTTTPLAVATSATVRATPTTVAADFSDTATVSTAALNLRRGPSVDYPIITALVQGDELTVIGQNASGTWLNVRTSNGRTGWVSRSYTSFGGTAAVVAAPPLPTPFVGNRPSTARPAALPWRGEYFANRDLDGSPVLVRSAVTINFDWGLGSPGIRVPSNNWSARWTRSIELPEGTYTFNVRSDDGARVYLDDELIIDNWREQSESLASTTVDVDAGTHTLTVEYYEARGRADIAFWWTRTSQTGEGNQAITDWRAEYFANANLAGDPDLVRNETALNFDWGAQSPAQNLPVNRFSARFTRTVNFSEGTYRFFFTADDGVRLFIDGNLVVDAFSEGLKPEFTTDVFLRGGFHSLRVEYYENTGNALLNMRYEPLVSFPDWVGQYWTNATLSGAPAVVRNDTGVDFNWGSGSPAAGIPTNGFSARWQRTINFEPGTYRFRALADDGVRVFVDGQTVIDDWRDGGAGEVSGTITLASGSHDVRVDYYENQGDASIRVFWERVTEQRFDDWKGEYFGNRDLSGSPLLTRNDREIDFRWGTGAPALGLPTDNFSARWSRTVDLQAGTYRFFALADDGVRISVDGNRVIDAWRNQSGGELFETTLTLGGTHRITVEYYEATGGARVTAGYNRTGDLPTATVTPPSTELPPTSTATAPAVEVTPTVPATSTPTPTSTLTETATAEPSPTSEATATETAEPTATETPVPPTVEPMETATATATTAPVAQASISGLVCLPDTVDVQPVIVSLRNEGTGEVTSQTVADASAGYSASVAPGSYIVYAHTQDNQAAGAYSAIVANTGTTHTPLVVTVAAGDALTNIDICDWDGDGNDVPELPTP